MNYVQLAEHTSESHLGGPAMSPCSALYFPSQKSFLAALYILFHYLVQCCAASIFGTEETSSELTPK